MKIKYSDKVYEIVKSIPNGYVTTYKEIAIKLGNKNLSRAVGNILHNNTNEDEIPCYKVVNSKGMLSKSFAFGGIDEHRKRLIEDGIVVVNNKVDLSIYLYKV